MKTDLQKELKYYIRQRITHFFHFFKCNYVFQGGHQQVLPIAGPG